MAITWPTTFTCLDMSSILCSCSILVPRHDCLATDVELQGLVGGYSRRYSDYVLLCGWKEELPLSITKLRISYLRELRIDVSCTLKRTNSRRYLPSRCNGPINPHWTQIGIASSCTTSRQDSCLTINMFFSTKESRPIPLFRQPISIWYYVAYNVS